MKKNLMVMLSLSVILAFVAPVITSAQAGKSNFTGTWTFNVEKSDPLPQGQGGGRGMGGGDFVAKQDGNLLQVDRTNTNQEGQPVTTTMKYTLDGKESVNTTARGESKSVAVWSADGATLTISTSSAFTTQDGSVREMKSKEVWVLTDAVTVTRTTSSTTQDGTERVVKRVYNKK